MPNDYKAGEPLTLSMVRYCNPTVVPDVIEKAKQTEMEPKMKYPMPTASPPLDTKNELQELLNEILPPRYWEANGKSWQQIVSPEPATREDVVRLQDTLDTRLAQTQARGTGLCMVRHGIYAECFDEIIRQSTINCPERGLLLLRIRDEMKMSLDACEVLYTNAVEFGLRKAIQAAKEKQALTTRVKDLAVAHVTVQKALEDTKLSFVQTRQRTAEIYASELKRFDEELVFAKQSSQQYKAQLESIVAPRK